MLYEMSFNAFITTVDILLEQHGTEVLGQIYKISEISRAEFVIAGRERMSGFAIFDYALLLEAIGLDNADDLLEIYTDYFSTIVEVELFGFADEAAYGRITIDENGDGYLIAITFKVWRNGPGDYGFLFRQDSPGIAPREFCEFCGNRADCGNCPNVAAAILERQPSFSIVYMDRAASTFASYSRFSQVTFYADSGIIDAEWFTHTNQSYHTVFGVYSTISVMEVGDTTWDEAVLAKIAEIRAEMEKLKTEMNVLAEEIDNAILTFPAKESTVEWVFE